MAIISAFSLMFEQIDEKDALTLSNWWFGFEAKDQDIGQTKEKHI